MRLILPLQNIGRNTAPTKSLEMSTHKAYVFQYLVADRLLRQRQPSEAISTSSKRVSKNFRGSSLSIISGQ